MRFLNNLLLLCTGIAVSSPLHLNKKGVVTYAVTVFVHATPSPIPSKTYQNVVTVYHTVFYNPPHQTHATEAPVASAVETHPAPDAENAPTQPTAVQTPHQVVTTAASPASASPTDYQSTALYHHNVHRANHTAGDLTWNSTIAEWALKTANTCVFKHDMSEGTSGYGQNLAAYGLSSGVSNLDKSSLVADSITNKWYNGEAAYVPYGQASPSTSGPEFLHFTQVIWKNSETVGCATVECPGGSIFAYPSLYTVCNYFPAGNYMGEFDAKVAKPIGNDAVKASIF